MTFYGLLMISLSFQQTQILSLFHSFGHNNFDPPPGHSGAPSAGNVPGLMAGFLESFLEVITWNDPESHPQPQNADF